MFLLLFLLLFLFILRLFHCLNVTLLSNYAFAQRHKADLTMWTKWYFLSGFCFYFFFFHFFSSSSCVCRCCRFSNDLFECFVRFVYRRKHSCYVFYICRYVVGKNCLKPSSHFPLVILFILWVFFPLSAFIHSIVIVWDEVNGIGCKCIYIKLSRTKMEHIYKI